MDVTYINPFIESTMNTFNNMLKLKPKPLKPKLKKGPQDSFDVSGVIGLSGEAKGTIAVSFPKGMALKLVSKLLGKEIKIIDTEVNDGIGELTNIIAGNAKQYLSKYQLTISLPNVIVGKNHEIHSEMDAPTIIVPFECEWGQFNMELSLKTD